jgi:hypothetical protein
MFTKVHVRRSLEGEVRKTITLKQHSEEEIQLVATGCQVSTCVIFDSVAIEVSELYFKIMDGLYLLCSQ